MSMAGMNAELCMKYKAHNKLNTLNVIFCVAVKELMLIDLVELHSSCKTIRCDEIRSDFAGHIMLTNAHLNIETYLASFIMQPY